MFSRAKSGAALTAGETSMANKNGDKADDTLKRLCATGVLLENKAAALVVRGEANPDRREILLETYARDRGWVRLAKRAFGEKCMCQNCNNTFVKNDGKPYIEVHHIVPLHKGGEDGIWNLSVLCAHHHRMAHFARDKERKAISRYLTEENKRLRAAV